LALVACDRSPEPPLRVGVNLWAGNQSLHLAVERHLTGEFPVRLLTFPSTTEVIRALQAGQLDAASITGDELLLTAYEAGPAAPRAIAVIDISLGADAILVRPPARSMADLRGRRVGVESTGLGALMLARALQLHGIRKDEIRLVQVPSFDHERQFREGLVDAVVTFEPVRSKLLATGAVEVFNSGEIPGEVMDVLVATPTAIARRGPALRALLDGYYQGRAFEEAYPDSARAHLSRYLRVPVEVVDQVLKGTSLVSLEESRRLLSPGPDGLAERLSRLAIAMVQDGILPELRPTDSLVTPAFLPSPRP
ncbi:MAG TPA: ABC transporter substrate-binding protein, partial [Gemmatimonadales bacterium]|nr:ABC transporter substrate-binding protein [Gemmatimonadales bacterium]